MEHVDVLIVGAGISGIGMACHMRMKQPGRQFAILEGREAIGGTWDLFRYPGIRSDSDMFTFGYAFKPWVEDRDIATADAILAYLNETLDEYDVRRTIRFGHRVEHFAWSSVDERWVLTIRRAEDDEVFEMSCSFLVSATGYYNYAHGYLPEWEGFDRYQGTVAHPQHWPEDLDYAGKDVLVIGSGATAVTVVPSMAGTARHVTMLQRSPTYIFSRPAEDAVAKAFRRFLPSRTAYRLSRIKNIGYQWYTYTVARKRPDMARQVLRDMAIDGCGDVVDVDVHFNPRYDPWDQRLCLIPDGDLYASLREGSSSIVTDTIDHFTETGVKLTSGATIDADIVVPATGLELQFLGGASVEIDGVKLHPTDCISYKGMMFGNIPNWVAIFGYTSASWTLKVDLTADFVCRLLAHMDDHGYRTVRPALDGGVDREPVFSTLTSGYVQRAVDKLPSQGTRLPWRNQDNYLRDVLAIKYGSVDDGVLAFGPPADRDAPFVFANKTAVVTGAASGIGRALALELAARGCHLALVDRDATGLAAVADAVTRHRVRVSIHVVDMGDADAVAAFPEALVRAHPVVDLLINNAGVALGGRFEEASREEFEWLMNINFYGVVNMTRALLPLLKARPDAHIVNLSSTFGLIAPPGQAAYCASKFAVRGFSESLRHELADTTVGVSVVHPGGIQTSIARNARIAAAAPYDDDEIARRRDRMEKAFRTPPQEAAAVILAGVEARRARILVGNDARMLAWLERLLPTRNMDVLRRFMPA